MGLDSGTYQSFGNHNVTNSLSNDSWGFYAKNSNKIKNNGNPSSFGSGNTFGGGGFGSNSTQQALDPFGSSSPGLFDNTSFNSNSFSSSSAFGNSTMGPFGN